MTRPERKTDPTMQPSPSETGGEWVYCAGRYCKNIFRTDTGRRYCMSCVCKLKHLDTSVED